MANWAITDYAIEGPKETLDKIYAAIKEPKVEEGSSNNWEGNVLKTLGITYEDRRVISEKKGDIKITGYYLRGFIQEYTVEYDSEVIKFSAEEAWGLTDFSELLEKEFPDIKVYWTVEECGCDVFATNDKEGKYFTTRYYVNCYIDGDCHDEYFPNKEMMYDWIKVITGEEAYDEDSVKEFNDNYAEACEEDENHINIYEYDVED